jgi:hypothetical protein
LSRRSGSSIGSPRGRGVRETLGSLVWVTLTAALASCTPAAHPSATAPQPSAATFVDDGRPLPRFHSRRLELSLPLPDGHAWRIDDHSQEGLVATHAPTRSRVLVAVFAADELVGRSKCEELARARRLVGDAEASAPRTVEDQVAITQGTYDTRIEVTLRPGSGPDGALGGRVMAFGGFLRKCYVFDYSTEVEAATDEAVLSSRLAFVRARVLGGLELQPFDAVGRDASPAGWAPSPGPKLAPGP